RRHTRSYGDWSSDVCSSDLEDADHSAQPELCREQMNVSRFGGCPDERLDECAGRRQAAGDEDQEDRGGARIVEPARAARDLVIRSEERRVGKGGRGVRGAEG